MSKAARFLERVGPHRDTLTGYCRRLLWSEADLEDALQETLAVAYREFRDAERGGFRRWVLRIATWTCFNLNRRRRRTRAEELPDELVERDAVAALETELAYEQVLSDPAAAFEGFDDELAAACRALNENERAIFLLKSLGGLTCAEIAETLDVPLGTAQGLLTRARHKMRARLADFARARGLAAARRSG